MKNKSLIVGLNLLVISLLIKSLVIPFLGFGGVFIFGPIALAFFGFGVCYTVVGLMRLKNKTPETPVETTNKLFSSVFSIVIIISIVAFFVGFIFFYFLFLSPTRPLS